MPNISETYLQYKQLNKYTSSHSRIDIWLNEIKKLRISLKKTLHSYYVSNDWISTKRVKLFIKMFIMIINELYIYISRKKVFDEIKFGKLYTKK